MTIKQRAIEIYSALDRDKRQVESAYDTGNMGGAVLIARQVVDGARVQRVRAAELAELLGSARNATFESYLFWEHLAYKLGELENYMIRLCDDCAAKLKGEL